MPVANATIESLVTTCERRARRPAIVMLVDDLPDRRVGIQFAARMLAPDHMEAAAATLLRALRDDMRDDGGMCPDCPACQDRALRVAAAIAALEARPATEGAH